MAIKKCAAGWLVDLQPGGRGGRRFRKTLGTKAEALAFEAWLKEKVRVSPEWAPSVRDRRRLSELVSLWFVHHGVSLSSGANTRDRLLAACAAMRDPVVSDFSADVFAAYRASRVAAGKNSVTLNREHAYLRAVFNELGRLGLFSGVNPLAELRQFKVSERELSFLSVAQIQALLVALDSGRRRDALFVARVCLATGARWSEAESLRVSQVRGGAVHFSETKSGKNRSVPVSPWLIGELKGHLFRRYGDAWELAPRYFFECMGAFREGVERAGLVLPAGQLTHVLRHTFASHFMMNGGNILVLQKVLGHASLTMTMRYAHLAPDHLQEAVSLNPLARLSG